MVRKIILSNVFLLLLVFVSSCKFAMPSVGGLRGVQFVQSPSGDIGIEAEIQIKNPNSFGFSIKRPLVQVELNKKLLGEAKGSKKIRIKRYSDDFHKLAFYAKTSAWQTILQDLPSLLTGSGNIRVYGSAKACVFLFCKKFSFDQSERISNSSRLFPSK
ncbi:MAG: LEA type 2 family protein [Flavobacteriales bacterium]|nr:LEA type 2 family protein [Flavobacteriales bacterium]